MAKLDLGGAASGGASGAAFGGSVGGLPGAALGGLFGSVAGLFGKKRKAKKRSTMDKRQQMINEQQQQGILGKGPLADLYNYDPEQANAVFDKTIGRPAYRNFQENIVPGITGSFRKQGLEESGYVTDALGKAGRDVQEGLDAQRAKTLYGEQKEARGAKRSAIENYQNRANFQNVTQDPSGVNIKEILDSLPPGAIDGIRDFFNKQKGI